MEILIKCVLGILVVSCAICDDRLELPAFEYRRQFQKELVPGQCPDRIIQYPQGSPKPERCTYPSRAGKVVHKPKRVSSVITTPLNNVTDLFKRLPMCNEAAADYFGLLAKGDCVAADIAKKLSFTQKTATLLQLEHLRPRINSLSPSHQLNIPPEYTLYLNNSYYTEKIGIGTEEATIVELWFKDHRAASNAANGFTGMLINEKLSELVRSTDERPRKVKVIRLSTADHVLQTKVFKGMYSIFEALDWVKTLQQHIKRVKNEILHGIRQPHLKYSFKAYEIGPIALPLIDMVVTKEEKRMKWEEIAQLQIEAGRSYTTNKRYRKYCRTTKQYRKYCQLAKQTLRELKETITEVHTQRRDWTKFTYEDKSKITSDLRSRLSKFDNQMRMVSKQLRKVMRRRS